MIIDTDRDEQSLALRDEGRSFVGIAGILGLDSARARTPHSTEPSGGEPMPNRRGCVVARWRDSTPSRTAPCGARRPQRGGGRPSLARPQAPTQGPLRCLTCRERLLRHASMTGGRPMERAHSSAQGDSPPPVCSPETTSRFVLGIKPGSGLMGTRSLRSWKEHTGSCGAGRRRSFRMSSGRTTYDSTATSSTARQDVGVRPKTRRRPKTTQTAQSTLSSPTDTPDRSRD